MKNVMINDMKHLSNHNVYQEATNNIKFLNWLLEDNFIFLGSMECNYKEKKLSICEGSALGIMRNSFYKEKCDSLMSRNIEKEAVFVKKAEFRSIVYRTSHILMIFVKRFNFENKVEKIHIFFGFLSSKVYYQSVLNIPLISSKTIAVVKLYGYPEASYNYKELIRAIEEFPRSELLQMKEKDLFHAVNGIVSLTLNPKLKLFMRKDNYGKYVHC